MKLVELNIRSFRGVTEFSLTPNSQNCVIYGPNGSGKSAIVDAVDFVLTGEISRLVGPGTAGITLKQHGPHIDSKPAQALVSAKLKAPGLPSPFVVERSVAKPAEVLVSEADLSEVQPVLDAAKRAQYILTRREILRYVASEPSNRAQQVLALLGLVEIEEARKALVKVRNELQKESKSSRSYLDQARKAVARTARLEAFDITLLLEFVNGLRAKFSGEPLAETTSDLIKAGVKPPGSVSRDPVASLLRSSIDRVRTTVLSADVDALIGLDAELRDVLEEARKDALAIQVLRQKNLVDMGLALIDDTGICPLCDYEWPPGTLRQHLLEKSQRAVGAEEQQKAIGEKARELKEALAGLAETLDALVRAATAQGIEKALLDELKQIVTGIGAILPSLDNPLEEYGETLNANAVLEKTKEKLPVTMERMGALVPNSVDKPSEDQLAWDTLTSLEQNLRTLEGAEGQHRHADLIAERASILHDKFIEARDQILEDTFESIKNRFVDLYRILHGNDEGSFGAELQQDGAGLQFQVEFYGRGMHPPHALHSEGHQDSMGLALFLALQEHLNVGGLGLVVLDDVMMSVDSQHRRALCEMLAAEFPDTQFLITTHDQTWANQLRTSGVAGSGNCIEFFGWSVETGPLCRWNEDMWQQIETSLKAGKVREAAPVLRRGMEEFCAEVCDDLEAKVRFRMAGNFELGDLQPAAMSQYKTLLKAAIQKAQNLKNTELFEALCVIDSERSQIFKRLNVEQWAVNKAVHYTNWENFTQEDFRPVVEAFQDFCSLFFCPDCGSRIKIAKVGLSPTSMNCQCGNICWAL